MGRSRNPSTPSTTTTPGMLFGFDFFLKQKPDTGKLVAPLAVPPPFRFKLDRFNKGIDNVHIDVMLSPKFADAAVRLVRQSIEHDANENLGWKSKWIAPPTPKTVDAFLRHYAELMDAALGVARKASQREPIQLAQFALFKFLLVLVGAELRNFRDGLHQERGYQECGGGKAMRIYDQLAALSREMPQIHHRVAQNLFGQVLKVEAGVLAKRRKSLLGRSWPVPREILFNPILLLPSPWQDEQLVKHYPPVGGRRDNLGEFAEINQVITGLFADYLPEWTQPPLPTDALPEAAASARFGSRLRLDQGNLPGFLDVDLLLDRALREEEYAQGRTSWLDDPGNFKRLLSIEGEEPEALDRADESSLLLDPPSPQPQYHMAFRLQLAREAQLRFRSIGLLERVYALYEAPAVFEQLGGQVPVRMIIEYLEGDITRVAMGKRLAHIKGIADVDAAIKRLEHSKTGLRRRGQPEREKCVADFMVRFARLRRDLKLAHRAFWIMDQINLLEQPSHIELSRSNRSLHEFVLPEERVKDPNDICGHTILKADLRGSSRITKELRKRNLNPATHFTLNFFTPINDLLEKFGAKKVFVEGDAVILSLYEYESAPQDWLSVCRAAGLARKILDVVDLQNAQNRKHDLPPLELGLGICYLDEAPAFLYDGDHEIMISAAINRADRLSSCAASLRQTRIGARLPRGVEVAEPVNQGIMQKDSGDSLLRYNVNGIELDAAAFPKLCKELALQRIEARFPQYSPNSLFYVGRYPDKIGAMHWLVIREAPVRLWIGNDADVEETGGRLFYEVVTDPQVTKELMVRLVAAGLVSQRETAAGPHQ